MHSVVVPKPKTKEWIQNLVTKAFVLEAVTDKPGCTTRYVDLEGRPLEGFLFAGINSAAAISQLAENPDDVFAANPEALRASNWHKSDKFVNFGLLEIMFPTVAARLHQPDPTKAVAEIIDILKKTNSNDIKNIMQCRRIAWSTSEKASKTTFDIDKYEQSSSVWDFYMKVINDFSPETAHFQWCKQFELGLPVLAAFFEAYRQNDEYLETTKTVFVQMQDKHKGIRVGILADFCAAALFLFLSYKEDSNA